MTDISFIVKWYRKTTTAAILTRFKETCVIEWTTTLIHIVISNRTAAVEKVSRQGAHASICTASRKTIVHFFRAIISSPSSFTHTGLIACERVDDTGTVTITLWGITGGAEIVLGVTQST